MNKETAASPTTSNQPMGLVSIGLVLLTAALWGGTPVAIRYSAESIPPVMLAAIRFALAAVFMAIWCQFSGTSLRIRAGQGVPILIAGLLLFPQITLFNYGVYLSNASHGSTQINTFVFWVVAIEHFVTRTDRLNSRRVVGLVIAFIGAMLILLDTQSEPAEQVESPTLIGDALLLISALVLAIKIVVVKYAVRIVEPGKLIFWHGVIGVMLFLLYSFVTEEFDVGKVTMPAAASVLYQGLLVAGLCFVIQAMLLRKHSATQISVFSFSTPLFGVLFAVLMRGDRLSPWFLLAAIFVATGILLVNWTTKK